MSQKIRSNNCQSQPDNTEIGLYFDKIKYTTVYKLNRHFNPRFRKRKLINIISFSCNSQLRSTVPEADKVKLLYISGPSSSVHHFHSFSKINPFEITLSAESDFHMMFSCIKKT